jgi:RHS repeat-associated protein
MPEAEYTDNALDQQLVRHLTQTGEVIHAVHDLDGNRIAEYLFDPVLGSSTLIREYIWMNGRAFAVVEGGQVYFVRTDHIGRPVFATNHLGLKVWEASYLPFGGVHVATGGIALRFPGQWFQSESGLHQNWMRDYDPTTGRYLQADPLGLVDGASVYGYVLGNPGRYVDPTGEAVPLIIAGAVAGVALGALLEYLEHGANLKC